MYGIGGTEDLERVFAANTTQLESPQLLQGLLGSTGDQSHALDELIAKGANAAAQLGQYSQLMGSAAGNDLLAQRQAAGQQAAAQLQQQAAQRKQGLMSLAMSFLPGGIGKWLR